MKLALGTVQFGLAYGAFNQGGQVSREEVAKILDVAREVGISVLDTAHAYGNSESVLGELDASERFRLITKLPALDGDSVVARAREFFEQSLQRLHATVVDGLLLHRAADLLGPHADALWQVLQGWRDQGLVRRIGFSAYGPEEALNILQRYPVELIQLPINVFDRRHIDSGLLDMCMSRGVEIHARSVFLQGFALSSPAQLSGHLSGYRGVLERFQKRCEQLGVTPMQAALRYVLDLPQIHQVVVGVERCEQLAELLLAADGAPLPNKALDDLGVNDLALVDPSRWK